MRAIAQQGRDVDPLELDEDGDIFKTIKIIKDLTLIEISKFNKPVNGER